MDYDIWRDSELEEGLNEKKLINNKNRYDREEG